MFDCSYYNYSHEECCCAWQDGWNYKIFQKILSITCEFHQSTATILCLGFYSEFEFVHAREEEMEEPELFGDDQSSMMNNFNVFLELNYKYFIL